MTDQPFDVGYGKPPVATRFRPGVSGNPSGRPRKIPDLANDLRKELSRKVSATLNGKPQRITKQRALVRSLVNDGLDGDRVAQQMILALSRQLLGAVAKDQDQGGRLITSAMEGVIEAEVEKRLASRETALIAHAENGDDDASA
jgi:hypothetical protein